MAWDFTVASERSLAGRMLHIRDDAFGTLGDTNLRDLTVAGSSPTFTIDTVTDLTPAEDDRIARKVEGTLTVPCYVTNGCAPGGRFSLDRRGLPRRLGTMTAKFNCNIPRSALDPAAPPKARPSLYGHGLLGRPTEIDAGNVKSMSNEHNFVFCATAWAGFSDEDVSYIAGSVLADLSRFNTMADRMQQGFLNMLFLGRAMIHRRACPHPAFQKGGQSVLDTTRLFFDGNSQGGIMGGSLTAVAPDFDRAVLGVPGMNYSTLLQRSVDFDTYAAILYPNYRKVIDRQLWLQQIQLLWDRGEANGYAQHMTSDPLPNTPSHKVLMHVAFGDHQVSDTAAEVQARTIGARGYRPVLDTGRSPWPRFQMIPRIGSFPFDGSAIVMWDTGPTRTVGTETVGTDAPPSSNTPNRSGDDPHEEPAGRRAPGTGSPIPAGRRAGGRRRVGRPATLCHRCRHSQSSSSSWGRVRSAPRSPPWSWLLLRRVHDRVGEHDRHRAGRAVRGLLARRTARRPASEHARALPHRRWPRRSCSRSCRW